MAGEQGFEPQITESESAVIPLNYSPMATPTGIEPVISAVTVLRLNLIDLGALNLAWANLSV